jgi:hypothetical protein
MDICHFSNVDIDKITEYFSSDRLHRAFLKIPLKNRAGNKTICIVGQNPSKASIKIGSGLDKWSYIYHESRPDPQSFQQTDAD